jgi:hypothetical protein
MSCRMTSAGSHLTRYARLINGRSLSDPAVNSAFHELTREYNTRPISDQRIYTREEFLGLLDRQEARVRNPQNVFTDADRASMLERLERARVEDLPTQPVLYALHNITPKVRTRTQNLNQYLINIAERLSLPVADVKAEFELLSKEIRGRAETVVDTYTPENKALSISYGLGIEKGLVNAVAILEARANSHFVEAVETTPPRIVLEEVLEGNQVTGVDNLKLTHFGYDQRSRRLEVVIFNTETGLSNKYAYQNISTYMARMNSNYNEGGKTWYDRIRGQSEYAYATIEESTEAGLAPRCLDCGQFSDNKHRCPSTALLSPTVYTSSRGNRWSREDLMIPNGQGGHFAYQKVKFPPLTVVRQALKAGPVEIKIDRLYLKSASVDSNGRLGWDNVIVEGSLFLKQDENGVITALQSGLSCDCKAFARENTCIHINQIVERGINRYTTAARRVSIRATMTPEELAIVEANNRILAERNAIKAIELAKKDWTRDADTLLDAKKLYRDSEVLYTENFEAFEKKYSDFATARKNNGNKPVIPYMKENALDGFARRGSGQAFGIEIEYDYPPNMDSNEKYNNNHKIRAGLYALGLTSTPNAESYHSARGKGFKDTHLGNWTWERDGSVSSGGEIVTPAMYDEPETWEYIEKVSELLNRNGAIAKKNAGAHVHVGTALFQGEPSRYSELARMMNQHEDVVYRLASNTTREKHRLGEFAKPNREVDSAGFTDIGKARSWNYGRYHALNFEHIKGDDSDHVEFRLYDATLDAASMQAQVKLSVAMVNRAVVVAELGGTTRTKEPMGSHFDRAQLRGTRKLSSEDLKEESTTFRSLIDTLFSRPEDKDQLVAVWANTKWTKRATSWQ